VEFIKKLPPVKPVMTCLKDQMLADQVRLQAALAIKTPTVLKLLHRAMM